MPPPCAPSNPTATDAAHWQDSAQGESREHRLESAIRDAIERLRDADLSEGCNVCDGIDAGAVRRVADDLEHALR